MRIAGTFARSLVSRVRWLTQMAITVAAGLIRHASRGYPARR